ncbi:hypothetical protein [Clostridium estertheticum]|uniref:hypothetical protein n=1 Tax=Clostridium estertheticum TaxID=238834 RepID=UPI001CF31C47|nr:hypothetical protein [Clostridium estertheticum]MCB2339101.1 hypothetical protein [Clostridium estertheticum]
MNNYQENYIFDLQFRYNRKLNRYYEKHGKRKVLKLIIAIEVIETENRVLLWRICEYLSLVSVYIIHLFINTPLINFSIGRFQIKLEHLFDVLNIKYFKYEKKLYLNKRISPFRFIKVIQLSNKYYVVEDVLKIWFPQYDVDELTLKDLEDITLAYSGNDEWNGEINYFSVMKKLYFNL